jgi:RNA polymerase sigma-70 factor (ECF subfamily)
MEVDEAALVAGIHRRDANALAQYVVARRGQLLAYIERRLGAALRSKIEPEDVLQEVSAEALRSLPAIDLGDRDPFSWLCQVSERRIVDAHRRFFESQKRAAGREVSINAPAGGGGNAEFDATRAGLINMLVASMTTASQAFSRDQKQMRLLDALTSLGEEAREALRLRYVDGLPSKEIAQKMNKSDGAIRVLLTRSLAKLQEILGE